jgi:hypothetical protein
MALPDLQQTDPRILALFLDMEEGQRRIWPADELGAILRHQLETSVQLDLEGLGSTFKSRLLALPAAQQPGKLTFGQLFQIASPPADLLNLVKQFAKASRVRGETVLPPEIATVLYLASIVVARLRCGKRISDQSDESLTYGIQWVLDQPWADETTRQLFRAAMKVYSEAK